MSNEILRIKKIDKNAIIPQYQTNGSAGFDLHASLRKNHANYLDCTDRAQWEIDGCYLIRPFQICLIPTGIAVKIPEKFEIQIRPRSGLAIKHGITVYNSPGTVDSDYTGELQIMLINLGVENFHIQHGDRIAQAIINYAPQIQIQEVSELEETSRGNAGFGSTGV